MHKSEELRLQDVTIGVITALPKEYAAVRAALGCAADVSAPGAGAGRQYALAKVPVRTGGQHIVAVALLPEMGNNSAAIRAAQMLAHCNPEHIIMSGIAGAIPNPAKPDEHVRLGDLVISGRHGVVQYDFDKEILRRLPQRQPFRRIAAWVVRGIGLFTVAPPASASLSDLIIEYRHSPRPPSAELLEAVNVLESRRLERDYPWEAHIERVIRQLDGGQWARPPEQTDRLKDWEDGAPDTPHPADPQRRLGAPRLFYGTIASANKLLKNPLLRDALRDQFKALAVEMEASGIADATWNHGIGYLVVRGTCDYCNSAKSDAWQGYAAVAAACYTRCLIETIDPGSTPVVAAPQRPGFHDVATPRSPDNDPQQLVDLERAKAERIRAERDQEVIRHFIRENTSLRSEVQQSQHAVSGIGTNNAHVYEEQSEHYTPEPPAAHLVSGFNPDLPSATPNVPNPTAISEMSTLAKVQDAVSSGSAAPGVGPQPQAQAWLDRIARMVDELDIDLAVALADGQVIPWLQKHEDVLDRHLTGDLYARLIDLKFRQARRTRSEQERRQCLVEAELFLEKAKRVL